MAPLVSVVVPFYNVESYIAECLESLAAQTLADIEVILVDDGSVDGSRRIADEVAARDPRFVVVRQPNRGPGPARNEGLRWARGAYLAFADSDDVVPPEAYELLVSSLERTGSDLACGGVRRIRDGGLAASSLHEKVFRREVRRTHIMDRRVLVRDRTVWNKVYRKDFWDEHRLRFPSGIYEDVPLSMRAHVLADSVDLLPEVVYHWRKRELGEVSITQRRAELSNLGDRLEAICAVRAFLREEAPELIMAFDGLVLEKDIVFLFQALEEARDEDIAPLHDLARQWLAVLSPAVLASAPSLRRLELHLMERGLIKELRGVREFRRNCSDVPRIVPRGLRKAGWYGDYPFFRDRSLKIPDDVFDASNELKLLARVEECRWTGSRFTVLGEVAIHRVERRPRKVQLWLSDGSREVPVPARRTGGGKLVAEIDPVRLKGGGPNWRLHAQVETRGLVLNGHFRDGDAHKPWRLSVPGWSRTGMDITQ
ncbi:glycosyltransferase family 2 protein [Nonomuraea lactucae]|uniref:glycosyltransferase family 2 protein n=1 Tax=Nonomuraea lactucae TaxID=2249762 RepID=UPI000DE3FA85|nr:glycosyltransferase family 2 protein [Nonomuraea lactucae]